MLWGFRTLRPNGSRLSCGRLARQRKVVGRQSVPRRGHNTPVPLRRSPPVSFKRLLGSGCPARFLALVANSGPNLSLEIGRNGIHFVYSASVVLDLAHHIGFVGATNLPIAIDADVAAGVSLSHSESPFQTPPAVVSEAGRCLTDRA